MRCHLVSALAAFVLASGCIAPSDTSSQIESVEAVGGDEGVDRDECKIEGSQIGREGTVLHLGAKTVTFHDWVGKTGEHGEFVGFSITVEGALSLRYVVKTGGETYSSSEGTWMHPAGPNGQDKAPGISNVDLCDECTSGDCEGGGDGDGGPILL